MSPLLFAVAKDVENHFRQNNYIIQNGGLKVGSNKLELAIYKRDNEVELYDYQRANIEKLKNMLPKDLLRLYQTDLFRPVSKSISLFTKPTFQKNKRSATVELYFRVSVSSNLYDCYYNNISVFKLSKKKIASFAKYFNFQNCNYLPNEIIDEYEPFNASDIEWKLEDVLGDLFNSLHEFENIAGLLQE